MKLQFLDTTLRDGEQAPGYSMNLDEKVRMALQLEALGVDAVESGFPAASRLDSDCVRAVASALRTPAVVGLCRARDADIDRAAEALAAAKRPRIHVFLATSELHLREKLHISRDECLEAIRHAVDYARNRCGDIEFSAEDASRSDPDFLCRAVETAIAAGATTINLPDTVGYATPTEFGAMVADVIRRVPNAGKAVFSVHCHDDLGMAVANTLAGISAGARQAECTICGIGERAGNAALEEVAMAVATRRDAFPGLSIGIVTQRIAKTARILAEITGHRIPPDKAIVGRNAFAHESGIHQHGVISNALTYQIMRPEDVGINDEEIVLGRHSGRHAFEERLTELGYSLDPDRVGQLFERFKGIAERKKEIRDRDIVALVEASETPRNQAEAWRLASFVVNSGNAMVSTACVTLRKGRRTAREVAMGTGPVYACVRAVEKIVKHPFVLEDYQLSAVTERRDALGEARVLISDGTGTYRGRGVSTDVIEASILACLAGVNAMLGSAQSALGTGAAADAQRSAIK